MQPFLRLKTRNTHPKAVAARSILAAFLALTLAYSNSSHCSPRIAKSHLSSLIEYQSITTLLKDASGTMWIGTQFGLYRYDGTHLDFFDSDDSNPNWIPDSFITGIAETSHRSILITTAESGLFTWSEESNRFAPSTPVGATGPIDIAHMSASSTGGIWFASTDREIYYSQSQIFFADSAAETSFIGTVDDYPLSIIEPRTGELLVGTQRGLVRFSKALLDDRIWSASKLSLFEDSAITALSEGEQGWIYAGTDDGKVLQINLDSPEDYHILDIPNVSGVSVSSLAFTENSLLIGTDRGLYIANAKLSKVKDISNEGTGLGNKEVQSLLVDGDKVWVGTYFGLSVLTFSPFQLFQAENSGISNDVVSFYEDLDGKLWVGTFSGLFYYDSSRGEHARYNVPGIETGRISTISGRKNRLWIGYYQNGIRIIDTSTNQLLVPEVPNVDSLAITTILPSKHSRDVWIGTYDSGLIRIMESGIHSYQANTGFDQSSRGQGRGVSLDGTGLFQ